MASLLLKIRKKPWTIAVIVCLLVMLLWPAPVVKSTTSTTLNGTWMTHLGASLMYYSTRLDDTIADLAKHKINTLYPAVWDSGHTSFNSRVMQQAGGRHRNPWINLPIPFSDSMAGLVKETQRQSIRLIPWFEYGLMIPIDADIIKPHPDWLTRSPADPLLDRKQGWLNPFHPEVQQFLIDLMVEVVTNYKVAGIQLDDHFGLPIEYGYDPYTIALYQAEHQGKKPPNDPANPDWVKWRADRLTQFMARISSAVKATGQDKIVSLSPNTADFAYRTSLQDWPRWVKMGLLDEVIVQLYRPNLESLQAELDRPNLRAIAQQVPVSIGLYTGPFNNAKPAKQITREVEAIRSAGYAGTSFFCWETTFWLFRR
jgi:uncharacterized lipoprotein YddW (UPF0748 family)